MLFRGGDFEHKIGIKCSPKFYNNITTFISDKTTPREIKKFLYNLGIPFSQKVFISVQPYCGFSLTWKMVIKYSNSLFNDYQQVWDKTLNWKLECNDYGEFIFGKGLVYNSFDEATKIEIAIREMTLRNTK